MKYSLTSITIATACATLLTGCLVPERFTAKVDVNSDASYTFHYAGTVIHAVAAAQLKKTGSLSKLDQDNLAAEATKLSKTPDVRKASYKGAGRFELEIESHKQSGQPLQMFDIFYVKTGKPGEMTIASAEINAGAKQQLETIGITIDGTLEVRLPKNAEVLSHNATSKPLLGMFGAYSWKIGGINSRPQMTIRFKQ